MKTPLFLSLFILSLSFNSFGMSENEYLREVRQPPDRMEANEYRREVRYSQLRDEFFSRTGLPNCQRPLEDRGWVDERWFIPVAYPDQTVQIMEEKKPRHDRGICDQEKKVIELERFAYQYGFKITNADCEKKMKSPVAFTLLHRRGLHSRESEEKFEFRSKDEQFSWAIKKGKYNWYIWDMRRWYDKEKEEYREALATRLEAQGAELAKRNQAVDELRDLSKILVALSQVDRNRIEYAYFLGRATGIGICVDKRRAEVIHPIKRLYRWVSSFGSR